MSDWREACTPMRDQGDCGSCTSFGTLGIASLRYFLTYGLKEVFSVQDLFACSGGSCAQGNTMEATFERAVRGVPVESCLPYQARDTRCGEDRCEEWWQDAMRVTSWVKLESRGEIDAAIDRGGVIATMAVPQSFLHYIEGDYHPLPFDPIIGYHCVGVVGRDPERSVDLIRNSWGTKWGMDGYCWIAQDTCELEYYRIDVDMDVEPDDVEPPDDDDDGDDRPWSTIIMLICLLIAGIVAILLYILS